AGRLRLATGRPRARQGRPAVVAEPAPDAVLGPARGAEHRSERTRRGTEHLIRGAVVGPEGQSPASSGGPDLLSAPPAGRRSRTRSSCSWNDGPFGSSIPSATWRPAADPRCTH